VPRLRSTCQSQALKNTACRCANRIERYKLASSGSKAVVRMGREDEAMASAVTKRLAFRWRTPTNFLTSAFHAHVSKNTSLSQCARVTPPLNVTPFPLPGPPAPLDVKISHEAGLYVAGSFWLYSNTQSST